MLEVAGVEPRVQRGQQGADARRRQVGVLLREPRARTLGRRPAELIEQARGVGAAIIQHYFADLDRDVVAEVQAAGIEIWAWPPANAEEVRLAYESGAVGLMGDDVAAISALLLSKGD